MRRQLGHGPRIPDRPVRRFRPRRPSERCSPATASPPTASISRWPCARGLFFRADEVTIPDFEAEGSKPFQYRPAPRRAGEFLLAIAGAPVRRFRGTCAMGEGGARRRPARGDEEAAEGEEGGEEGGKKPANKVAKPAKARRKSARRARFRSAPSDWGKHSQRPLSGPPSCLCDVNADIGQHAAARVFVLTPPGCASRPRIPDRPRRSRGCGRCVWRRRGRRRRVRSANRCRRPAAAWRRRPRW